MRSTVHLESGEIFELSHIGIGTEPMRGAVRDVIALYLAGTNLPTVESTFTDGASFTIEHLYDEGDVGHEAGSREIIDKYSTYIVAGPIVDQHNGIIIVSMGKPVTDEECALASASMEKRIANLEAQLDSVTRAFDVVNEQKRKLEFENLRISQEFKALQDMIHAVGNAKKIIPEGEPIGDPDDLYPPDMPVDSLEKDEDPTYPVEEPEPIEDPPAEIPPVIEETKPEKKAKEKKTVEKKVYKRKTPTKTKAVEESPAEKPKKPSRSKKKTAF